MSTRSRTLEYLVLGATLVLFFAVAEAVARLLVPAPLSWRWPQVTFEPSPSLVFRLKPLQVAYTADKPFQVNSMGLRGPERSLKKPEGVHRILVLGDSIAFGYGVAYNDSFPQRLETLLNDSRDGHSYQVIDAGVPSFNTLQEVTYFREEGVQFDPDVAILAVCWNDVSPKSSVAVDEEGQLIQPGAKPSVIERWTATKQGYWVRNLLKQSSFLYFVVDRVRALRERIGGEVSREVAMRSAVLSGSPHPDVARGWAEIDGQLAVLAGIGAARGIKIVVAILPIPQGLERHYEHTQYPGEIARMCQQHGLRCVDLQPAFERQFAGHTSLFIPYDGDHPNERGHRIIAESLYDALREGEMP